MIQLIIKSDQYNPEFLRLQKRLGLFHASRPINRTIEMYLFEEDNWCWNAIPNDWSSDAEQDWYEISLPGLPTVWSYILYLPIYNSVSFNRNLTVIYSTKLVWKTSQVLFKFNLVRLAIIPKQAERIWGRLNVSFLYYAIVLLLRDCI